MLALNFFKNWTTLNWILFVMAAGMYLIMSARIARQMAKIGRSPVRWFFISLFFTAIPSSIVLLHRRFGWLTNPDAPPPDFVSKRARPCPNCGERLGLDTHPDASGVKTCPCCRQVVDEGHLA